MNCFAQFLSCYRRFLGQINQGGTRSTKKMSKVKIFSFLICLAVVAIIILYQTFSKGTASIATIQQTTELISVQNERKNLKPYKCKTRQICLFRQKEKLTHMLRNGMVNFTGSNGTPWARLLPSESELLNTGIPNNPLDAGNETTSSIEIIDRKSQYREGDWLTVLVTIRDGHGQQTRHGGDQVRVWMVDDQHGAALAAEVVDLRNGSYTAAIPLAWSGYASIKASLSYNLMTQRAHYYVRNIARCVRYIGAGFTTYFANEITLCSPFPSLMGYNKICNFTEENGGMPWFCGMPKERTLTCRHWTLNFDFDFISPLQSTVAEKEWWMWIKRNSKEGSRRLIGSSIELSVQKQGKDGEKKPKSSCQTIPFSESWNSTAPRGHFEKQVWIPMACSLDTLTQQRIHTCLRNTTVLVMGDSNARLIFHELASRTKCKMKEHSNKQTWHYPLLCIDDESNTEVRWRSHALPFHMGSHDAADRTNQKSANHYIDEIPRYGRFLVVVHLYIHFTPHHDDVFVTHMKAVHASIQRLLQRNPETKVVIRAPHTFGRHWMTPEGGDLAVPFYTKYTKEEFKDIQDRVFFLQPWDMTVAIENEEIHPPNYVTKALINLTLGHVCE